MRAQIGDELTGRYTQVGTNARYDRRPEEMKRKAAELLLVPFVERGGAGER